MNNFIFLTLFTSGKIYRPRFHISETNQETQTINCPKLLKNLTSTFKLDNRELKSIKMSVDIIKTATEVINKCFKI